jgi:hypothetical protein
VKCPYDQGIFKNIQSVLGRWPMFWFVPGSMAGTGLDFPINTKSLNQNHDLEKSVIEKDFSSSTSLNRSTSIDSQWTSTTELRTSTDDDIKVDITPLAPLKTKPSTNTIGSRSINALPHTPASVLTFASTATTLVDYHSKLPTKRASDYSMTYR